ncbi:lkhA, partial [Symbiodinium microadriaticum]
MENPCLTFATPTLLAGDKSLADVIAHEIAHSWTGNLVTNCTWDHFWLNEGWTVWLERKVMARVKGDVAYLKLSAQIGYQSFLVDLERQENGPYTRLVWPLQGGDPDDAFSVVPYEKGFNLLFYLESLVGTAPFEAFAKIYLERFKFKTVSSGDFKEIFMETFSTNTEVNALDWDALFYDTGLPSFTNSFDNALSKNSLELADKWIAVNSGDAGWTAGHGDIEGWSSQQTCVFLEKLISHAQKNGPFSLSTLEAMDLAYALTAVGNAEIKFRWQTFCILSEAEWIVPHVIAFLKSQGRMKFVRPLYRSLYKSAMGSDISKSAFLELNE